MKDKDKEEIILEAISRYGAESQLDMVIEESAELIHAINKLKRNGGIQRGKHQTEIRKPRKLLN